MRGFEWRSQFFGYVGAALLVNSAMLILTNTVVENLKVAQARQMSGVVAHSLRLTDSFVSSLSYALILDLDHTHKVAHGVMHTDS